MTLISSSQRRDAGRIALGCVVLLLMALLPAAVRPTSKDQCKDDGWKRFTNPAFKNQGQCIKYAKGAGDGGGGE